MLEGIVQTVYSETAAARPRLQTPGGAVSIGNAVETAISVVDAARFGYLVNLTLMCTAVSTTAGTWTLRDGAGGNVLQVIPQPVTAAVVGTKYCFCFPSPWKTNAINKAFTIQGSVATMGTWTFLVNGFMSST